MKPALPYGAVAALIVIAFKLFVYFFHLQLTSTGIIAGIVSIGLMAIPLYAAIKKKRDQELGGYLSLRQGMRVGLGISAIAGIVFASFLYVYYEFIDHETSSLVLERVLAQLREANATPEQIEKEIAYQKDFYSPFNQAFKGGLLSILGAGFILSFICSTLLVRKGQAEN